MEEEGPVRLSCRAMLDVLQDIKNSLSSKNLKRFRESCFGAFLDLHELQFQGQLHLQLLLKQSHVQYNDKIVFHVNNSETELGQREFALLTGLHFGPKPAIPPQSKIHKKTFKGKKDIMVSTIRQTFTNIAKKEKGDGEVSLKLALLLVVYGLLIIRKRTSKKVDIRYIHLVDDLETFNKFPWGRVAFDMVRDNIHNFLNGRENRDHVDVYGFGFVLQLWAYEAIPIVARVCAKQPSRSRNATPRMLRWKATSSPRSDVLRTDCFPALKGGDQRSTEMIPRPKLVPTSVEVNTTYYRSILDWEKEIEKENEAEPPADVRETRKRKREASCGPSECKEVPRKQERKGKTPIHKEGSSKEGSSKDSKFEEGDESFRSRVEQKLGAIEKKQERLEKFIMRILLKLECSTESDEEVEELRESDVDGDGLKDKNEAQPKGDTGAEVGSEDHASDDPVDDIPIGNEEQPSREADEEDTEVKCDDQPSSDKTPTGTKPEEEADVSSQGDKHPDVAKSTGDEQSKPFENVTPTTDKPHGQEVPHEENQGVNEDRVVCTDIVLHQYQIPPEDILPIYKPLVAHVTPRQVADFARWWGTEKDENTKIDTSVSTFKQVDAKWFSNIWESNGWLSEENIDALLHLLLTKVARWPDSFVPNWTCVDTMFWELLTNRCWDHWVKSKKAKVRFNWAQREKTVMKYVFGRLPRLGNGKPWSAVDFVYGVGNVGGSHWILYELRIKTKLIVVYDSQRGEGRMNAKHNAALRRFAEVLGSIFHEAFGDATQVDDGAPWPVQICVDSPQQTNSSDCGVLCMKMLECLLCYTPLEEIDPTRCDEFRKVYCTELYKAENINF